MFHGTMSVHEKAITLRYLNDESTFSENIYQTSENNRSVIGKDKSYQIKLEHLKSQRFFK